MEAKQPQDQEPESLPLRASQHDTLEHGGKADDARCSMDACELAPDSVSHTDNSVSTVETGTDLCVIHDSSASTNLPDATEQRGAEGSALPSADVSERSTNDTFQIDCPAEHLSHKSEFGHGPSQSDDQAQPHGIHDNENESRHAVIPEMKETGLSTYDGDVLLPFSDTLASAEEDGCMTISPDMPADTNVSETMEFNVPKVSPCPNDQDVSTLPEASLQPIFAAAASEEIERRSPDALNRQQTVEQQADKFESPVPIDTGNDHIVSTTVAAMDVGRLFEGIETHMAQQLLGADLELPERDQFNQSVAEPAVTDAAPDTATFLSPLQFQPPSTPSPTSASANDFAPDFASGYAPTSVCSTAQEAFMAVISGSPNSDVPINPQQSHCLNDIGGIKIGGPIYGIETECEQTEVLAESQCVHVPCSFADSHSGASAGALSTGQPSATLGDGCQNTVPAEASDPSEPPEFSGAETTHEPTGPNLIGNVPPQSFAVVDWLEAENLQTDAVKLAEGVRPEQGIEIEMLDLPANNGPQDFSGTAPAAEVQSNFAGSEKIHIMENLSVLDLAEEKAGATELESQETRTHDPENPPPASPIMNPQPLPFEAVESKDVEMLQEDTIDQTRRDCVQKELEFHRLNLEANQAEIALSSSALNIDTMIEHVEPKGIGSPPSCTFDEPEQETMEKDLRIRNAQPQTSHDQEISTMSVEMLDPSIVEEVKSQNDGSCPEAPIQLTEGDDLEMGLELSPAELPSNDKDIPSTAAINTVEPTIVFTEELLEEDSLENGMESGLAKLPSTESDILSAPLAINIVEYTVVCTEEFFEGEDLEQGMEIGQTRLLSDDIDNPSTPPAATNTVEPMVVCTEELPEGDNSEARVDLDKLPPIDSDIPPTPTEIITVEPTVVCTEELPENDDLEKGVELAQAKLPSNDSDTSSTRPPAIITVKSTVVCTEELPEGEDLEKRMEIGQATLLSNDSDTQFTPFVAISVEPTFMFAENLHEGHNVEMRMEIRHSDIPSMPQAINTVEPMVVLTEELFEGNSEMEPELCLVELPSNVSDIPFTLPLGINTAEPMVVFTEDGDMEHMPVSAVSKLPEQESTEQVTELNSIQPPTTHDEQALTNPANRILEPSKGCPIESIPVVTSDVSEERHFEQTLSPGMNHETSIPAIPAEMIEEPQVISCLDRTEQETFEYLTELEKSRETPSCHAVQEFAATPERIRDGPTGRPVEFDETKILIVPNVSDFAGQESAEQTIEAGLDFKTAIAAPNVEHLGQPTEILGIVSSPDLSTQVCSDSEDVGVQGTHFSEPESFFVEDFPEQDPPDLSSQDTSVLDLGCSELATPKQSGQKTQSTDRSESKLHNKQASSITVKKSSKGKFRNPTVVRQAAVAAGALLQKKTTPIPAEIPVPLVASEIDTTTHDSAAPKALVPAPTKKRKTFRTPTSVPRQNFEPRATTFGGKSANTMHLIQSASIGIKQLGLSAYQLSVMVRKDSVARTLLLTHTQLEKSVASVAEDIRKVKYAEKLACNGESETTQKLHSKWLAACRMALEELRDLIGPRTHEFDESEPKTLVREPRKKKRSKKAKKEVSDSEDEDDEDEKSWAAFIAGMPGFEQEPSQETESDNDSCSDTSSSGDNEECEKKDSVYASSSAREGGTWSLLELGAKLGVDVKALGKYDQENDCFE
ncbi:hypothetical protein HDU81_000942 [Chytriomyces hyalinus]|nr:hypothetical protein HDU81_000942 [Chytriomyces hyalinus]